MAVRPAVLYALVAVTAIATAAGVRGPAPANAALAVAAGAGFANPGTPPETARLTVETLIESRQVYALAHSTSKAQAPQELPTRSNAVIAHLKELADKSPTPKSLRRLALMQRTLGDPGWKETVLRLGTLPRALPALEAEREQSLWRAALEDDRLDASQVTELRTRITRLELGWYEHLALEAMYGRAGMADAARAESAAAQRTSVALALFWRTTEILGQIGAALGIGVGTFLIWRRKYPEAAVPKLLALNPPEPLAQKQGDALYSVFLAYVLAYAAIQLGIVPLLHGPLGSHFSRLSAGGRAGLSLGLTALWLAAPLAVYVVAARRAGLRASDVGLGTKNLWVDIVWGIGGYAVALPLVWAATAASHWIFRGSSSPLHPALNEFSNSHSAIIQFSLLMQATVLAPIAEETLFRGVFFRALWPRIGMSGALLVASAVFAALHPQIPIGFLGLFALGIVFNLLYALRGSLIPSIVAHALNNGSIFLFVALLVTS